MKVCILRLSALGDVVLASSVIDHLAIDRPDITIDWIIDEKFASIFSLPTNVQMIPVKKIRNVAAYLAAKKMLQHKKYDVVFCMQASMSSHLFLRLIQAQRKIGFDAIRGKDFHHFFIDEAISFAQEHLMDGYFRMVAPYCKRKSLDFSDLCTLKIEPPKSPLFDVHQPYIFVTPISQQKAKTWDISHYLQLFKAFGNDVTWVVAGEENLQAEKFCSMYQNQPHVRCIFGKSTLQDLIYYISKAKMVLSPDSGPIHIANNLQVPVVAMFGATSEKASGPYFQRDHVVSCYEKVREQEKLPSWCFHRIRGATAMDGIHADQVIAEIKKILNGSLQHQNQHVSSQA